MRVNQAVETSVISAYMRVVSMSKETRSKIPEGVTRVINTATGEVKLDKVKELEEDLELLKLEILLKDKRIKELEAKLHGTRRHVTEVNQVKIDE